MRSGRRRSILTYMVILALTVLVWGAVAMSEVREYPLKVKVEMTGFERSRYAVLQADSVVTLQVASTGFKAFLYEKKDDPVKLKLDVNDDGVRYYVRQGESGKLLCRAVAVDDLGDLLTTELSSRGMHLVGSAKDSLRLVLSERKSKVFRVDISNVNISFAEGYGLYGESMVTPSEVTLYGDEESLSRIEKVAVKPLVVRNLKEGNTYSLDIDTNWHGSDVYASVDKVMLQVHVEQYVEREYEIPVSVEGLDSLMRINLYPDKVALRVWIPQRDIASVTAERFSVSVDYRDVTARASKLKARLTRFPQKVRVHSLTPEEVNYVVIK